MADRVHSVPFSGTLMERVKLREPQGSKQMKKSTKAEPAKDAANTPSAYNIQAVQRACDILKCFQQHQPGMTLSDVVTKTNLSRTTAFRLLATLVEQGMLERPAKNQYRAVSEQRRRNRHRIGYASQ